MPITIPHFKVYQSAGNPPVPESQWTKLVWDSPWEDNYGWFDFTNHRYVVQEFGLYLFIANLEFANIPDGGVCDIAIWRNGGAYPNNKVHTQFMCANPGQFVTAPGIHPYIMYPGDCVEVYAKHAAHGSGDKIISTDHEETWFAGFKVG